MQRKAGLFGMPIVNAAVPPVPPSRNVPSVLTRPEHPGAPKTARSIGSGPNSDVVRLKPKTKIIASTGRLFTCAVNSVPIAGGAVAVLLETPSVPGQPGPKKP